MCIRDSNTIMTSVCSPEMDHSTAMVGYDPNRSVFTNTSTVGDRMVVKHPGDNDADEEDDCSSHISAMLTGNYSPVPSYHGGGGTSAASSIKDGIDTLGPNRGDSSSIRRDIIARTASLSNNQDEGPSTVQSEEKTRKKKRRRRRRGEGRKRGEKNK
eukprot:TRINITY_DN52342_c0_g1_i1.p1 TRINITY_DN52342_c0_g1~~TRINITY_DN52342_c0_g1_i1.p1  ORF type:complete len:157 (+),score=35.69 TRINITY_DN52342_c0_g1_i1:166-636(+)